MPAPNLSSVDERSSFLEWLLRPLFGMNYYAHLVAAVCKAVTTQTSPKILGLVSDTDHPSNKAQSGTATFPPGFLPDYTEVSVLSGIEHFAHDAREVMLRSEARCVFAAPPFLGSKLYPSGWRARHGHRSVAELLAETALGDDSKAECLILLAPFQFTSSLESSSWRQDFFPAHSALIVEHCHDSFSGEIGFGDAAALQLTTVVLQRTPGPIRFLKITAGSLSDGPERIAADVARLLKQPAGKTRYGYVYQGPLDLGYPCSYDYYSEETVKLRAEIGSLGSKVTLSSVADILLGYQPCRPGSEEEGQVGFPYINGRDISLAGHVDLSDTRIQHSPSLRVNFLKEGDFCIPRVFRDGGALPVGVFEGDGRAIAFGPQVIVVRPQPTLNAAQRQVLLSYLRSPLGYRLTRAKQSLPTLAADIQVSSHILAEFPVPLADEDLVTSIQRLNEARAAFNAWIAEIDRESNAIIEEVTASGSRRRLLQAGQLARQRHRAGEQVEELDYRIRTQFPHSLAYVWRQLQVTGPDRYHRLKAILKAAEGHTCFVALIAVLMSRTANQTLSCTSEIAKRLSERRSGTNFGDWFSIIKEVNGRKEFRNHKGDLAFGEVAQLCSGDKWEPNVRKLMDLRNDDSHGRIASSNVSQALLDEAEEALEVVFRATEFLTDYRLMYLTETRFDSIRKFTRFKYRDLTGDNPLAQLREDQSTRSDLESESLYLRDRQGQLHLFRPLLHYLECRESHQMSTFYLDTFEGSSSGGVVGLKSFETSSVRQEAVADDFRHVGLLKATS